MQPKIKKKKTLYACEYKDEYVSVGTQWKALEDADKTEYWLSKGNAKVRVKQEREKREKKRKLFLIYF